MNKLKLTLLAVSSAALTGCSDGPSDVAEQVDAALCEEGKFSAILPYVSPSSVKQVQMTAALFEDPKKGPMLQNEIKKTCDKLDPIVSEDIEGNKALITYKSGETKAFKKIDGEWKYVFE